MDMLVGEAPVPTGMLVVVDGVSVEVSVDESDGVTVEVPVEVSVEVSVELFTPVGAAAVVVVPVPLTAGGVTTTDVPAPVMVSPAVVVVNVPMSEIVTDEAAEAGLLTTGLIGAVGFGMIEYRLEVAPGRVNATLVKMLEKPDDKALTTAGSVAVCWIEDNLDCREDCNEVTIALAGTDEAVARLDTAEVKSDCTEDRMDETSPVGAGTTPVPVPGPDTPGGMTCDIPEAPDGTT